MQLKVEQLSFGYRNFEVLKGVEFSAETGDLICVLGKNGAGKSTLFRCVLGLLKGYKGKILVDGTDVKGITTKDLARKIAYIPQNHDPAFAFSALDMVLMGTTSSFSIMASPGEKQKNTAYEAMKTLGIRHLADRSYGHLSGGEQQLVLIARAIAQEAGILVMDEPCANLDYGNQARVMEELKSLAKRGYLIIQSTHSPDQAFLYADQAAVLIDGRIKAMGDPSEILTEEILQEMYGIPVHLFDTGEGKLCMPGQIRKGN